MVNAQLAPLGSPIQDDSPIVFPNGAQLTDRTLFPKAGAKGNGLASFLLERGIEMPEAINKGVKQSDDSFVLKLGQTEIAWLGANESQQPQWEHPNEGIIGGDIYSVPRRHGNYYFHLSGIAVATGFSPLCSIDLRAEKFRELDIAQTIVAKTSGIIFRADENDVPTYHLLGDISLASYIWDCLKAAMEKV